MISAQPYGVLGLPNGIFALPYGVFGLSRGEDELGCEGEFLKSFPLLSDDIAFSKEMAIGLYVLTWAVRGCSRGGRSEVVRAAGHDCRVGCVAFW